MQPRTIGPREAPPQADQTPPAAAHAAIQSLTCCLSSFVMLAALMAPAFSPVIPTALAAIPDEQRIEVVIHDYTFELVHRTPPKIGGDTIIILRNQDIVRHGFTSTALPQLYLRVEGDGLSAYGKGIEGVYVEPGKTLVVRLLLERSGRLTFHCDLHPEMKGELFLLDIPAV